MSLRSRARTGPRSRPLVAALAVLVAATGLAVATSSTASAAPQDVTSGGLDWGVKASFRSYVAGPIAQGSITLGGGATLRGLRAGRLAAPAPWLGLCGEEVRGFGLGVGDQLGDGDDQATERHVTGEAGLCEDVAQLVEGPVRAGCCGEGEQLAGGRAGQVVVGHVRLLGGSGAGCCGPGGSW